MKKSLGHKVSSNLIKWKAKVAGLQRIFICEISFELAVQEERTALKTYMKLKAGSVLAREMFLEDLAEAQSKAGNLSKASILRQLKNCERNKHSNWQINWAYDNGQRGRISFVTIKDHHGQQIKLNKKCKVEKACMEENEARF